MTQVSLDRQFSFRETPRYPTTFRVWQRRTKTGCLTCRSRKKKCDETKPWCGACRRSRISCIWLQYKQPDALQTRPRNEALTLPNDNNRLFYIKAYNLTNLSSLLLQHYTSETAVILPAGKPSLNPFISFVLPPAETDGVLMHSVLAVSGAHLSFRLQDAVDVEMAARKHYVFAIRGVQQAITGGQVKDKSDILRLLLVTSFLSQYEVSLRGLRHLTRNNTILDSNEHTKDCLAPSSKGYSLSFSAPPSSGVSTSARVTRIRHDIELHI